MGARSARYFYYYIDFLLFNHINNIVKLSEIYNPDPSLTFIKSNIVVKLNRPEQCNKQTALNITKPSKKHLPSIYRINHTMP